MGAAHVLTSGGCLHIACDKSLSHSKRQGDYFVLTPTIRITVAFLTRCYRRPRRESRKFGV
jgi:hypothetical protein